jgi:hypothetical protein
MEPSLVWKNLKVEFDDDSDASEGEDAAKGEFLTAFVVPPNSPLQNKSLDQLGYSIVTGCCSCQYRTTSGYTQIRGPRRVLLNLRIVLRPISSNDPLKVGDMSLDFR